jgi:hypothetical protein
MKQKILLLTILTSLSVASISLADDNSLLAGTWSSKCAANNSGGFTIQTFNFTGNNAAYSVNTYSDSDCRKQISDLISNRTFSLGGPFKGDTRKLDYVFNSVTMTYTDPSLVQAANAVPGYYGFTNWVLNQPKDVTGLKRIGSSTPEHAKGEKFYTIVKKDNDILYMGDYSSGAGTSDATRLSLIYNVPFIKVKS